MRYAIWPHRASNRRLRASAGIDELLSAPAASAWWSQSGRRRTRSAKVATSRTSLTGVPLWQMLDDVAFVTLLVLVPAAAIAGGIYLIRWPNKVLGSSDSPALRAAVVALRTGGGLIAVAGLLVFYFVYVAFTDGFGQ
jgi:hypothetical protein